MSGAMEPYARLADVYDEIVVDACHGRWATFLDELWSAGESRVSSVLDLCCGTGLLAEELIARGYGVAGVDASESMLDQARRRLGPDVPLDLVTLPGLPADRAFDAVVSTFDSLNYLDPDDLRLAIAAIARCLRPAGWLVFDLHADAMMEFTAANPVVEGEDGGRRFRISSTVDTQDRVCETRIDVMHPESGDVFTEIHRQYFHDDALVRTVLGEAGLDVIAVTDEYTDEPASRSTSRATWIARLVS